MMLSNQLQIPLKGLLVVPAYPSYFRAFYAASDTTDTHPGPLMENKGHGWGTDHHLSRLLLKLVSAYVNLFHFLPDLVEAIITELALNVGCHASLMKSTSRQAAGWLNLMTEFTQMHFQRQGASPTQAQWWRISGENSLGCVCWWWLISAWYLGDPSAESAHPHPSRAPLCTSPCPSDVLLCVV